MFKRNRDSNHVEKMINLNRSRNAILENAIANIIDQNTTTTLSVTELSEIALANEKDVQNCIPLIEGRQTMECFLQTHMIIARTEEDPIYND